MNHDLLATLDLARALVRRALRTVLRAPSLAVRVVRLELQTYQLRRVLRLVVEEHRAARRREQRRGRHVRIARQHLAAMRVATPETSPPGVAASSASLDGARGDTRP